MASTKGTKGGLVLTPYVVRNGKKIFPKNAKVFAFVPRSKKPK